MGIELMGKVLVTATVENLEDVYKVRQGVLSDGQVRRLVVDDALVDTGASGLLMPARLIAQLGLYPVRVRKARTAGGPATVQTYSAVRLTIQGRDCVTDVTELPDDCPVLIGQVPLEMLDFVVEPKGQRLIGNPAHNGEWVIEIY